MCIRNLARLGTRSLPSLEVEHLERPIDVVFGPHGDMYVVDMGIVTAGFDLVPGTGAIWRITRK
jgi:hypothetical protein